MTWRELGHYIDKLPEDSATRTELRDELPDEELVALPRAPGYGRWSPTDYRIADLIDRVEWLIVAVEQMGGGKPKAPDPYPRPGVPRKQSARAKSPEVLAYMDAYRAARGGVVS